MKYVQKVMQVEMLSDRKSGIACKMVSWCSWLSRQSNTLKDS
jgi:hypothetical protein